MAGDAERGTCSVCQKIVNGITRKYYYYDIECDCCNTKEDDHFEIVFHCNNCEPKPPRKVTCSLNPLKDGEQFQQEPKGHDPEG